MKRITEVEYYADVIGLGLSSDSKFSQGVILCVQYYKNLSASILEEWLSRPPTVRNVARIKSIKSLTTNNRT